MERSLTVLLPIRETQATLNGTVQELLDILPDLTKRFEVLIVDNGATEATSETAHELARHFPQVRVVHQGSLPSREAAIRTGLERSTGEVVLLGEDGGAFRIDDIHKLWRSMEEDGPPAPRGPTESREPTAPAEAYHSPRSAEPEALPRYPGLRLLRRDQGTLDEGSPQAPGLRPETNSPQPTRPKFLTRLRNFALGE